MPIQIPQQLPYYMPPCQPTNQSPPITNPSKPPPSSPIQHSHDPQEELEAYFSWQIYTYPSQEAVLRNACIKLLDEYFTITDIRGFKDEQ